MVARVLRSGGLVACGLLLAATAVADYGTVGTLEDLAGWGDVIVRGTVHSVDAAWEGSSIYTYVAVDVAEVFRGEVPGRRITLKQLGGAVGDLRLNVVGQAEFAPGEEVLLFLAPRPRDRTLVTVALWQGKWTVRRDLDADQPQLTRFAGHDADGAQVLAQQLPLAEVEAAVREAVRARPRPAASLVFTPAEAPVPVNTVAALGGREYKIPLLGFSWHEVFLGGAIPANFHKGKQTGVGSGKKQIQNAFADWNEVPNSLEVFGKGKKYKGSIVGSDLRDPSCLGDTAVFHEDPNGEVEDNSSILAVASVWSFQSIKIRDLSKACNGYVITNDSASAISFMSDKTCYTNVVRHELGHVAGLGHSNKTGNLMFPSITQAECAVDYPLGKDDKKFAKKIYNQKYLARTGS